MKNTIKKSLPFLPPLLMLGLFWLTGAEATTLNDPVFNPLGIQSEDALPIIIGRVISTILGLTGVIALLMFVYGGVTWMLAQGNDQKVAKAKDIIVWSVLGLVIIFASYSIVGLVIRMLGQT
jgi:hypothetical protein